METKLVKKERKKGFNYLLYIAMLICILFAMYALLNVAKVQEECKDHYLSYINSSCGCGNEIDNYGIVLEVNYNESQDKNTNT